MGDPLGIGPEIVVRALADLEPLGEARFVIYGSNERLTFTADRLNLKINWSRITHDSTRLDRPIKDTVLVRDYEQPQSIRSSLPGPSPAGGLLSRKFVE